MLRPCPWASNELPGQLTPNREVRRSRGLSSSPDGTLSGGCPLLGSFICSQQGHDGVEERAEGWEAKPFQEELTPIISPVLGNWACWVVFGHYLTSYWGFPHSSAGKESVCNTGDLGPIPGLGRSPGEGKGCPLQYSGLENPMDGIVHGVAESDTTEQLSLSLHIKKNSIRSFLSAFLSTTATTANTTVITVRSSSSSHGRINWGTESLGLTEASK